MTSEHVRLRLWRSLGLLVAVFAPALALMEADAWRTESKLQAVSGAGLNGLHLAQGAEAAFRQQANQELPAPAQGAAAKAESAAGLLAELAKTPGVSPTIRQQAAQLGAAAAQFPALRSNAGAAAVQASIRQIEAGFAALQQAARATLSQELGAVQERARESRRTRVAAFALLALFACGLVLWNVRRSVLAPLEAVQSALSRERNLLQLLMDSVPDKIYFKDSSCRFVRVNRAQASLLGIAEPADALGKTDLDFFDESFARVKITEELKILETGAPLVGNTERVTRHGLSWWLTATKVRARDPETGEDMIVGISRDVTEWKTAQEALEASEHAFRLLFSAIPVAVWVVDLESLRFLASNQAATRLFGYSAEEFLGMRIVDVYPEEDRPKLMRALLAYDPGNLPVGPRRHLAKNGRVLDTEIEVRPLEFQGHQCLLVLAQDISERRRLEVELRHSQKLEAVGQLASGIAHEINTPIQFVGDNLRFLQDAFRDQLAVLEKAQQCAGAAGGEESSRSLAELGGAIEAADVGYLSSEVPKALAESLDGVSRVATIVRAMKAFAHPGRKEKAFADINQAIADTLIVARNEIKYVADVETEFGDLPPVMCHIADLNQVFLNILVNAAQAIGEAAKPGGGKGKIAVRTREEGADVVISISDTGPGIPEAIRQRIFEQFFTTKEVGKGTGQGLALSRAIVDKHGGRIAFEPNQPSGTTFHITIPVNGVSKESPAPAGSVTQ